jgi:hypothetical protein
MPGYWAVEIRVSDAADHGQRYLCRAQDDRTAAGMAARLMGSAMNVRGFDYFWIDPARLVERQTPLPALGQSQEINGAGDWASLMLAHDASEAAHPERGAA